MPRTPLINATEVSDKEVEIMVYEEKTFEVEELGDGSYLIIVDGVKVITTTPSQEVLDHIEMVRKTGE